MVAFPSLDYGGGSLHISTATFGVVLLDTGLRHKPSFLGGNDAYKSNEPVTTTVSRMRTNPWDMSARGLAPLSDIVDLVLLA